MHPKHASNGCKNIHIPEARPATGQAIKTRTINHNKAKQGFPPIISICFEGEKE
jgi:hypothetical protein